LAAIRAVETVELDAGLFSGWRRRLLWVNCGRKLSFTVLRAAVMGRRQAV